MSRQTERHETCSVSSSLPHRSTGMSHAPPKISRFEPAAVHGPATNARTVRAPAPTRATSARFPDRAALALIAVAALAASSSGCMNGGSQKAVDAGVTERPRCVAPEGAPTSPQTVADVLALVNAL